MCRNSASERYSQLLLAICTLSIACLFNNAFTRFEEIFNVFYYCWCKTYFRAVVLLFLTNCCKFSLKVVVCELYLFFKSIKWNDRRCLAGMVYDFTSAEFTVFNYIHLTRTKCDNKLDITGIINDWYSLYHENDQMGYFYFPRLLIKIILIRIYIKLSK